MQFGSQVSSSTSGIAAGSKPSFGFPSSLSGAGSGNSGAKPSFSFGGAAQGAAKPTYTPAIGSTGTPAATASNPAISLASAGKAPDSTRLEFKPSDLSVQNKDGTINATVVSLLADTKYKQYSLLEIRVRDYILYKKLTEIPTASATTTGTDSSKTAAGPFAANFLTNKTTTSSGAKANTSFVANSVQSKSAEEITLSQADIDKATEGLPTDIPAKIHTAEEFYGPIPPKPPKSRQFEVQLKQQNVQLTDYSILFEDKSLNSLSNYRIKTKEIPIVVTAEDLRPKKYHPQETDQFTPYPPLPSSIASREHVGNLQFYPALSNIVSKKMVRNFRITKDGIATIDFLKPVDITQFDFNRDIVLRNSLVDIYRRKKEIPDDGKGLNVCAMINMQSVWPKNSLTGVREETKQQRRLNEYERELRAFCDEKNAKFVFYLKEQGIFQFMVPNFVYGPFDLP